MPIDPKILRDLPPAARTYWAKADAFAASHSGWELVEAGSGEFAAWVRYFRWIGFTPQMIAMIERKTIDKIAVPARLPRWFDPDFQDSGELLTQDWRDKKTTPEMRDKAKAWLDRSDPAAAAMISEDVWSQEAKPGQIVDHREFMAHCAATKQTPRPIGAFEAGSYLGPSEINTKSKRKVYTEEEKAAFLEDAKRVGESIKGMKLSDAAKQTLR